MFLNTHFSGLQNKIHNITSNKNPSKMVSKTNGIFSNQIQKFEFDMLDKEITQEKPWCLSVTINPAFIICVYMPNEDFQVKISFITFCAW